MAASVNVALCPWLLYRSYICPVREPRHFTPAESTVVFSLFFYRGPPFLAYPIRIGGPGVPLKLRLITFFQSLLG